MRLLDRSEPVAGLSDAVRQVAGAVPWWPESLAASAFEREPPGSLRVGSIIDTADRCGQLPQLARVLAQHSDDLPGMPALSTLIDAVVDHYRSSAWVAADLMGAPAGLEP